MHSHQQHMRVSNYAYVRLILFHSSYMFCSGFILLLFFIHSFSCVSVKVIFIDLSLNLLILFSAMVDQLISPSKAFIIFVTVFFISGISIYYSFCFFAEITHMILHVAHHFHNILTIVILNSVSSKILVISDSGSDGYFTLCLAFLFLFVYFFGVQVVFFFFLIFIIVDLQCYVSFRCTAK